MRFGIEQNKLYWWMAPSKRTRQILEYPYVVMTLVEGWASVDGTERDTSNQCLSKRALSDTARKLRANTHSRRSRRVNRAA
jgi:hypothetical protein